jgi:hypothetical protein
MPNSCLSLRTALGVLCLGLLEYVPKEQEPSYVTEMVRVLKPDGIIIFSFLNAASPYWVWADHVPPIVRNIRAVAMNARRVPFMDCSGERIPTRKFRLKERIELLRAAGLSVIEQTYFSLNILPAPLDTRFPGQPFGGKLEHLLQKDIFGWLGMAFVIAARISRLRARHFLSATKAGLGFGSRPDFRADFCTQRWTLFVCPSDAPKARENDG